MLIRLSTDSPEPLYSQLASAVRGAVIRGDVVPGERLPSARELAESLGVNMHTVLKAYTALRDEGVLDLRRGRGAVVAHRPRGLTEVEQAARDLLSAGRRHGLTVDQIRTVLESQA